MPNHVENDLTVKGKKSDIVKFINAVKGEEPIDVNKIIPYPEHFKKLDDAAQDARMKGDFSVKDGYNQGGYEWCIENWSTKWGMYDFLEPSMSKNGTVFRISFNSAWSPPLKIIVKLGEMFPELKFTLKYYDAGMGFQGTIKMVDGKMVDYKQKGYRGSRGG